MPRLRKLLILIAVLTAVLMALGSFVRTTGAGLSCPDWPLCFGRIIPDFTILGVPQEVIHRYLATFVGLLTIALVVISFQLRRVYPKLVRASIALLAIVVLQGVLGGLTVTMKLNPFVVASHLTFATIFFQAVGVLLLKALLSGRVRPKLEPSVPFRRLLGLTVGAVFAQIVLGGFVGASGASMVCKDFPLCNGQLLPNFAFGPHAIQATHRLLGYLIFFGMGALFLLVKKESGAMAKRRGHIGGVFGLVILQILIGVGNIHLGIVPAMTIVHLLLAQVILLGLLSLGLDPDCRIFTKTEASTPS